MPIYIIAYFVTLIPLMIIDFIWISLTADAVYKAHIGGLMMAEPNLLVGLSFYLLYSFGIVVFAVLPTLRVQNWRRAASLGALLGLVAYGAYDLTNQATLVSWSSFVSVVDMAWGTVVTGSAAAIGYWLTRRFTRNKI